VATGARVDGVETTAVRFAARDDAFLETYVRTGECSDKAGAYAIQGYGAMLVHEIRGCFYNVMGFPVQRFLTLLHRLHDGGVRDAR
jgi:septum formation protein